jgi:hypothetical protein
MKSIFNKTILLLFIVIVQASNAQAETWTADQLHGYLKNACEISWQVEEAITDSNGNVQRDKDGNVRTTMVTRTRIDYSCVPSKFSNLRIKQVAEFQEVDENTFGNDYVFFDAGPVDLKCVANEQSINYFKDVAKGTKFNIEGTVIRWEPGLWDDNFVMNCGL